MKDVPQALHDLGELYRERQKLYGDNYKKLGDMLHAMFPGGLNLITPADFNRFALFVQLIHKCSRYAVNFDDKGHADSLDDLSVYAQMLQEFDTVNKHDF